MKLAEYIFNRCELLEKTIGSIPDNEINSTNIQRLFGGVDELEVLQNALESGEIDELT
jgi:hypothetical protein